MRAIHIVELTDPDSAPTLVDVLFKPDVNRAIGAEVNVLDVQ